MIEQIVGAECPIMFDQDAFARWNIPVAIAQQGYSSPSNGQGGDGDGADGDQQDAQDVVQPIDDELKRNPMWWLLEIMPMSYTFQNAQDKWATRWRCVSARPSRTLSFVDHG
jgi:hypothetical protein